MRTVALAALLALASVSARGSFLAAIEALTSPPAGTAKVAHATNGTALAGADYLAANGVLSCALK